jgi:dipeptidyl aminopeptidase/acylaminoacyl peptidase
MTGSGTRQVFGITFLLLTFLCAALIAPASAQRIAPLPVETVLTKRGLGELFPMDLSPDGKRLAYTVHTRRRERPMPSDEYARTGVTWYGFGCDIFVADTATGETINFTAGKGSNWLPSWSPDGRYLAFLSDRGTSGQTELWLWDPTKGDVRRMSDAAVRMLAWERLQWTPDSRSVLVTAVPAGTGIEAYVEMVQSGGRRMKRPNSGASPDLTVSVYRSFEGESDRGQPLQAGIVGMAWTAQDLLLVDVLSGKSKALAHGKRINAFVVSPDGSNVVYSSPQFFEKPGSLQMLDDLVSVAIAGTEERTVVAGARLNFAGMFSISPDGSRVAYCEREKTGLKVQIVVLRVGAQPLERDAITGSASGESQPDEHQDPDSSLPLWDAVGKNVYVVRGGAVWQRPVRSGPDKKIGRVPGRQIVSIVSKGDGQIATHQGGKWLVVMTYDEAEKQNGFYAMDLATGASTLLHEKGEGFIFVGGFEGRIVPSSHDGERVAYIAENAQNPADVWVADAMFHKPVRLSNLNPDLSKYKMGAMQRISWLSDDGRKLDGALLLPSDYETGRRCPLIVYVYGGADLSGHRNQFGGIVVPYDNIQLFATRGYAVLLPNAPQQLGTPMLDLAKTVLGGINKAIELGFADADRVGVMGSSYGGYSVLSLLVQTTRFKAAVETSGFGDLVGIYGQMKKDGSSFGTLAETGQDLMGGTPWQYRERYLENSPVFYLDRVQTPLLMIHGEDDSGVGVFLGDEIFVGLRRLGKEVEYARYGGEEHAIFGLANQMDAADRTISWFDTHLKGSAAALREH